MGGAFEELADVMYDFPKEYAMAFDIVHYVLCLVAVRADMGDEFDRVSTQHPFVSCPSLGEELHEVARWQNLIPSFPWIAPGWRV